MALFYKKDSDFKCPLCSYTGVTIQSILSHIRAFHANDANFCVLCGIDGCATTSRSFSALYSHVYRHHQEFIKKRGKYSNFSIVSDTGGSNHVALECLDSFVIEQELELTADLKHLTGQDREAIKRSSALLILKLKEHCKLSQSAINTVVEGCRGLCASTIQHAQAALRSKLADLGFDPSQIVAIQEVFSELEEPFDNLVTEYQQHAYFLNKLGLVEPQEILIGEPIYVPQFSGSKRRQVEKRDSYQYVPLLLTLKALLHDTSIQEQLQKLPERIHQNGKIEDFCNGARFKSHPLFSKDPHALQVIAHYDELEVCNPLGSHVKKHKVGVVTYTLGNIHYKYRSKLKLLQLAIVASIPVIEKHGLHNILRPLIHDLNILATTGIDIKIDGVLKSYKGALLAVLADNLASNDLGGFKKSFSFAFRCCRTCLVTKDTMSTNFFSEAYESRNDKKHLQDLKKLKCDASDHFSKIYGINKRSSLIDVKYFSIFEGGLPHDFMHDALEGLAPHEIRLMLMYFVSSNIFTLKEFNERLLNFDFGYSENDKPLPVYSTALKPDKTLRSSASQMLLLVRILPLLIADKIPENEDHWGCFILLRKIFDLMLAPIVTENTCSSLKLLIRDHHAKFIHLYGSSSYIPKMHFLLHYPEQMLNLGSVTRTWTMRYEAKLNFFKQSSHISNFKNIAFSLANSHQRWICYEMASGCLISDSLECGPSGSIGLVQNENKNLQQSLQLEIPQLSLEATICRPTWVKMNGILYKINNSYLVVDKDGLDPVFGRLDDILVVSNSLVVFQVIKCETLFFEAHYHAYAIKPTSEQLLYTKLLYYDVYHAHTLNNGYSYVSLKHKL